MRYIVILSVIASLAFSLGAYLVEGEAAFQSGRLLLGHSSMDNQCGKCHTPWGGVSNDKCAACHLDLFAREPNHGKEKPLCANCHLDHRGRHFDIKTAAKKLKAL